jgi:ParB-like chromosome segregation protein Spo0J
MSKSQVEIDWFARSRSDIADNTLDSLINGLSAKISALPEADRVATLNRVKSAMHAISPFVHEPVDCVLWVSSDDVTANDYNPNSVAPPEMKLLEVSIVSDGYTQPIVVDHDGERSKYVVVDGFHRNRVGRESAAVRERVKGYLPVVQIRPEQGDRCDRIASTIRHNRARGKHQVEKMSDIVVELKRRNWTDERIARELGMDQDEILRLCQVTGLADLFADTEFSKAWDAEGEVTESDFSELSDNVDSYGDQIDLFHTPPNTSDEGRIFHTYDKWECFKAGLYATTKDGMTKDECLEAYRAFLADLPRFSDALDHVIVEWKNSCEHYLTNVAMNRIAWLGQASMCYATGVPATFRGGFCLLTPEEQQRANETALVYLNKWLASTGRPQVTMTEALSNERQSDIY